MKVHKTIAQRFARNVAREMEKQGIGPRILAGKIESSRQYIYNVMDGTNVPSLTMVEKISKALNRKIEEMIK